jgi:hypothetical protein
VKPGDILYYRSADGTGLHIAIVQEIRNVPGAPVTPGDIWLIEMTFDDSNRAFVFDPWLGDGVARTLQEYINTTWRIVRLNHNLEQ